MLCYLGSNGGEDLIPEPQVTVGLCSHSLRLGRFSLDVWKNFFTRGACAAWEQAAEGSRCLHPWLDRALVDQVSSWGEPRFPRRWKRRVRGSCTSSVPRIRWGQLQPSAQRQNRRRHQDPCVVTGPESVKKSSWPPQRVRAAAGLNIHGRKTFSGCGHLQLCLLPGLTHPFPIPRSPEKVLCTTLPVRC